MSRNEPRKASKNLTRKRETKKLIAKGKKAIKKVTGGAPGFYTALLANTGQEKDLEKAKALTKLNAAIKKEEKKLDPKRPSKGRNVSRDMRKSGMTIETKDNRKKK